MKTTRRDFVKIAASAGTGLIIAGVSSCQAPEGEIAFAWPVDGDMLTENDGTVTAEGLQTTVRISGPHGARLKVNGVNAKYNQGFYTAEILLKDYSNVIEFLEKKSGQKRTITIYWLKNYTNKYRLSLDDNIWFLKDISLNALKYNSIFENSYLGLLKEVHDIYGSRIHINIYYQTTDFNLSQMTGKFKKEWIQNSDWLRLSFHALANDPDKPYIKSGYEEVKRDCGMVKEEIRRFAGEELLGPVTTLHWGEATTEGCRALKDSGYTALAGYFNFEEGIPVVSYYLDNEKTQHLSDRFVWRDNNQGLIFKKLSIVLNSWKLEQIVPLLAELKQDPKKSEFIDLMIHEQYFYPFYIDYQPDFKQKVIAAVKWATDNGYKPAFLSECVFS